MWVEAQRMWWGAERGAGAWDMGRPVGAVPAPSPPSERNPVIKHSGFVPLDRYAWSSSLDERLVFCLKIGCVVFPSSALVCLGSWSDVRFNVGLICGGGMVL